MHNIFTRKIHRTRIIRILTAALLILSITLSAPGNIFRNIAYADTIDEYEVTKSVLLKTSMGTYGEAGYYSSEFYTSLTYSDAWMTIDDKTVYNYGLSKFSVILSSAVYSGISCMVDSPAYSSDKAAILIAFGFKDTELFSISNSDGTINSDAEDEAISLGTEDEATGIDAEDATTIVIGHKPVTVDGESHDIYVVVIRGTTGAAEWESNYDVGNTGEEYIEKTGEHPEWTDYDNHKGFDVVANRVQALLENYVSEHMAAGTTADYLITGHSRGAGIANILGAKLDAAGYNSCAYTFASPNTTTNPDKYPARTVFNIINANDFIPTLPLAEWGFERYGTDYIVDIANDEITSKIAAKNLDMDYAGKDPSFLTDAFKGISTSRDNLYTDETFECLYDTLEEKNTAFEATKAAIEYLRLEHFISVENCNDTTSDGKYHFKETLSVGAFMVGLSRIMSDQANFISMFLTINHLNNVYPKDSVYSEALSSFMNALTSNLVESFYPHMTTCYYSIVEGLHEKDLLNNPDSSSGTDNIDDASMQNIETVEEPSKAPGFVGSTGFYIMVAAIAVVIVCAVLIIVIMKKKQATTK